MDIFTKKVIKPAKHRITINHKKVAVQPLDYKSVYDFIRFNSDTILLNYNYYITIEINCFGAILYLKYYNIY